MTREFALSGCRRGCAPRSAFRTQTTVDAARSVSVLSTLPHTISPRKPSYRLKSSNNFLRENLDRRAISNHRVYLFDLPVAYGDTARSPVLDIERLYSASGAAVNEDIASGRAPLFGCKGSVCIIWIGNAYGQVIETIWVPPVDDVVTLGRLSITFKLLVPFRCKSKADRICLQWTRFAIEKKQSLRFINPQPRDRWPVVSSKLSCASGQQKCDSAQ